jgi:hypothetical protein
MDDFRFASLVTRTAAMAVLLICAGAAHGQVSGAIFTTVQDGTTVDGNIYENGQDVYLNGGPQNTSSAGLDNGIYYFQVTTPNGRTLLSTTNARDRMVLVENGRLSKRVDSTGTELDPITVHFYGTANAANGSKPVQLWPFDPTTNNGGEYKAWLIKADPSVTIDEDDARVLHFTNRLAKTDNFKIREAGGPPQGLIDLSGRKFYDRNFNGIDDNEPGVVGLTITLNLTYPGGTTQTMTVLTGAGGAWAVAGLPAGTQYVVTETVPTDWMQTAPAPQGSGLRNYSGTANVSVSGLDFGNIAAYTVDGHKYYDSNANGVDDDGTRIDNFKFEGVFNLPDGSTETVSVHSMTVGSSSGDFWFGPYPDGTTFTVCEVLPPSGNWIQTEPTNNDCYSASLSGPPVVGDYPVTYSVRAPFMRFGNLLLGALGGHTLGFWSNRNGKTLMAGGAGGMSGALAFLSGLNLRDANGNSFDPTTYDQYRGWLLSATATNMAYMLSAQLTAMELNVRQGLVNGSSLIFAPGTNSANAFGFATVQNVMDEANLELGLHGYAVGSGSIRDYQTALKNALDAANNDTTFVLPPVSSVPWY